MPLPKKKSKKETNRLKKKYLFYGEPKSGKSTTIARFGDEGNKILFFCAEPGHSFLEIYKWERSDAKQPQNWQDFMTCCAELCTTEHDFKCLAIDTIDILWNWCTEYICEKMGISHPSEEDFGKAYHAIAYELSRVCNKLGQHGIGFIFVSHKKEYEATIGPRKETMISTTMANSAKKFIHGFVDYIWFFTSDPEGNRIILTDRINNIEAGSRGDIDLEQLPIRMPMDTEWIKSKLEEIHGAD